MDQAAALRSLAAQPSRPACPGAPRAEVIVIGSGKGGVGKSVLAVLFATALVRDGRRVLLVDGCQNQGNLHILLGVRPAGRLEDLLTGEADLEQLPVDVGPGLRLLPADSGAESLYALSRVDRARLHHQLSSLYDDSETVVVDGGPGIDNVVRVASMGATRLVVVTVPEPTALSDAYALIKIVSLQIPALPVSVLVNRTRSGEEGPAAFERLSLAASRFLGRELDYLGTLPEDDALRADLRRPGALLAAAPAEVEEAIARLIGSKTSAARGGCGDPLQTPHTTSVP
jgi:flagellar biosynthesis protein FlhG